MPEPSTVSAPEPTFRVANATTPLRIVSSDGVDILAVRELFAAHMDAAYARLHRDDMRRRKWRHEEERMTTITQAAASIAAAAAATSSSSTCPSTAAHTRSPSVTARGSFNLSQLDTSDLVLFDTQGLLSPSAVATAARSPSPLSLHPLPTIAMLQFGGDDGVMPAETSIEWCADRLDKPLPPMVIGCEEPVLVVPGALAWPPTIRHSIRPVAPSTSASCQTGTGTGSHSTGGAPTPAVAAAVVHDRKVTVDRDWLHMSPDRTTMFPSSCYQLVVHPLPLFAANSAQLRDLLPATFQGLTVVHAEDINDNEA